MGQFAKRTGLRFVANQYRFARMHLLMESMKGKMDSQIDNPAQLVSTVFQYSGGAFSPFQIEEELAWLIEEVRKMNPLTVLEIGTARGGTLVLWTRLAQPNATIVSIDLPDGKFGGGYSRRRESVYRRFARKDQKLHLLRLDSHAQSTFEMAKRLFGETPVDFLFIDGDHTYEGVRRDWEMYSQLVRPGGAIAFHDVAGNYEDTQVKRLWDSLKPDFRHRECIRDQNGYYGVGILYKE